LTFSDYIQKQPTSANELPMVHTTEYFRLPLIRTTNALQAHDCKIFKEPLLYFFYGRPAYRDTSQTTPTRDVTLYPICFVFGPGTIVKKAKRLYPFDTGASQHGLYKPAIQPAGALLHYQVAAVAESARKIVGGFFATDEEYLSNKPKLGLSFSSGETNARSYYDLIHGGGDPDCDDRYSAVEIQVAEDIDVREGLKAIVLPNCFLDDKPLKKTLVKDWKVKLLPYPADVGLRPIEFHNTIRYLIRKFYRRAGYLS
jgi:hypothetical protein